MNKADTATAREKDLFSRSPFLEMPMMMISSDEEVRFYFFTPSILVFLAGRGSDDQAGLDDLSAADQDPPPLRAPPTKSS